MIGKSGGNGEKSSKWQINFKSKTDGNGLGRSEGRLTFISTLRVSGIWNSKPCEMDHRSKVNIFSINDFVLATITDFFLRNSSTSKNEFPAEMTR